MYINVRKPTLPKIGKFDGHKCWKVSEITFRKTLRMVHGIAENDRTVQETPVENCIFQKHFFEEQNLEKKQVFLEIGKLIPPSNMDPSLLSALRQGVW